jgi:hypothetical protein
MLSVIILHVVILNVVAPLKQAAQSNILGLVKAYHVTSKHWTSPQKTLRNKTL